MQRDVWVIVEQDGGSLSEPSLELLTHGRTLADQLGEKVCAVVLSRQVGEAPSSLIQYGADRVYFVESGLLTPYTTEAHSLVLTDLIRSKKPSVMLFPGTRKRADLAPRIAAQIGLASVTDCNWLGVSEEKLLVASRPIHSGRVDATVICHSVRPYLATIRPRTAQLPEPDSSRCGDILNLEAETRPAKVRTKVIGTIRGDPRQMDLAEAEIVVAGGQGIGGVEGLRLLKELGDLLGAPVAGSRPLVDAGLLPRERLVGQSGQKISPRLYIACGISGAVQHTMGMKGAKTIVAINVNPQAPIFEFANIGIVGDVREVVPAITNALRARS